MIKALFKGGELDGKLRVYDYSDPPHVIDFPIHEYPPISEYRESYAKAKQAVKFKVATYKLDGVTKKHDIKIYNHVETK